MMRLTLRIIFVLLLLSSYVFAALAIDSKTTAGTGTTCGSNPCTLSYSFTNTAGTFLLVSVDAGSVNTVPTVSSVTYNGVAMTSVVVNGPHSHTEGTLAWYSLKNPATGANTVAISVTGITTGQGTIVSGAISFTGNDTTTPVAQSSSANDAGSFNTVSQVTLTSVAAGDISVDVSCNGTSMGTSSQTLTWKDNFATSNACGNAASSTSTGSGSVTMKYTGNGSDFWAIIAVEVKAASGGGGGTNKNSTLPTLGVGQ